jgi:plastocyanin
VGASGAAAKPAAPLPSGCPSPSPAASAAAGASAAAKPAAAASVSAAAKPSFTPLTDVTGEPAPGPYTENGQVTATTGTPVKLQTIGITFQANTIVVKAGDNVTLNLTNCATFQHNFMSPALGVPNKVDIPVGGDANVTFKAPDKAGKYMFWCSTPSGPTNPLSHGERGMTGEIIVQ